MAAFLVALVGLVVLVVELARNNDWSSSALGWPLPRPWCLKLPSCGWGLVGRRVAYSGPFRETWGRLTWRLRDSTERKPTPTGANVESSE